MPEIFDFNGKSSVQDGVEDRITFTDGMGTAGPGSVHAPVAPISPVAEGYYVTKKRTIIDMLIGFFVLLAILVTNYLFGYLMNRVLFLATNTILFSYVPLQLFCRSHSSYGLSKSGEDLLQSEL